MLALVLSSFGWSLLSRIRVGHSAFDLRYTWDFGPRQLVAWMWMYRTEHTHWQNLELLRYSKLESSNSWVGLQTTDHHPKHHLTPTRAHSPPVAFIPLGPATYTIKIKIKNGPDWTPLRPLIYWLLTDIIIWQATETLPYFTWLTFSTVRILFFNENSRVRLQNLTTVCNTDSWLCDSKATQNTRARAKVSASARAQDFDCENPFQTTTHITGVTWMKLNKHVSTAKTGWYVWLAAWAHISYCNTFRGTPLFVNFPFHKWRGHHVTTETGTRLTLPPLEKGPKTFRSRYVYAK